MNVVSDAAYHGGGVSVEIVNESDLKDTMN